MCTPNIPKDTSAEQAAAQAAQREAQVRQGQNNIDSAFSKFDDGYFNNYEKAYTDNYNPQVDQQYKQAQQKERYDFARRGVLDSTPAINRADLLNDSYGQQRQAIGAGAIDAANTLRNNVAQQKSQLYALNSSAADPTLAAAQAAAGAGTIPSTPQYSVLGDLFGSLVNAGAAYTAGRSQNNPYLTGSVTTSGLPGGRGSGRVIN